MVWGAMTSHGVGPLVTVEGTITSDTYVSLLSSAWHKWFCGLKHQYPNATFQHDHAPAHTAKYTEWWLKTHSIPIESWIGKGADLSPIENLWDLLEIRIRARSPKPQNTDELSKALHEEWSNLEPERCRRLVDSLPRRVLAVIKARGWATKY
jgi:hypothetical protein